MKKNLPRKSVVSFVMWKEASLVPGSSLVIKAAFSGPGIKGSVSHASKKEKQGLPWIS